MVYIIITILNITICFLITVGGRNFATAASNNLTRVSDAPAASWSPRPPPCQCWPSNTRVSLHGGNFASQHCRGGRAWHRWLAVRLCSLSLQALAGNSHWQNFFHPLHCDTNVRRVSGRGSLTHAGSLEAETVQCKHAAHHSCLRFIFTVRTDSHCKRSRSRA